MPALVVAEIVKAMEYGRRSTELREISGKGSFGIINVWTKDDSNDVFKLSFTVTLIVYATSNRF